MEELVSVVTINSPTEGEVHYMTPSDLMEMLEVESLAEQLLRAGKADPTLMRRSNA